MFGKHFASMYTGSMFGRGAIVFAVMGYVIANAYPSRSEGKKVLELQVELNPALLAAIFGEEVSDVVGAIDELCAPDPKSRTTEEEGRRLVRVSQFEYRVVNGVKYREIRDKEQRREQNREAQERYRAKQAKKEALKTKKAKPLPGEQKYVDLANKGATEDQLNQCVTESLPKKFREASVDEDEGPL